MTAETSAEAREAAALRIELAKAKADNHALLDLLNAVVDGEGGKVTVPLVVVEAAVRSPLVVHKSADAVTVTTERHEQAQTPEPPQISRSGLLSRLWLPGKGH